MGYKKGSSTVHCSFLVMETVATFLREGTNPILVVLDMTMTFDKCKFSVLFSNISDKIHPVVNRAFIFVYERQYDWTRWGTTKSEHFQIRNGTHQGSVLSPALLPNSRFQQKKQQFNKRNLEGSIFGVLFGRRNGQ